MMDLKKYLHWLSAALSTNGSLVLPGGTFELGDALVTFPVGDNCPTTPRGGDGYCSLLKSCPNVFPLLTDFEVYKQFSCVIQNKYAGVCCPWSVT